MKSPLVESADYIKDKENYSDLQVLMSGAGYYIGTVYNNPEGYLFVRSVHLVSPLGQ